MEALGAGLGAILGLLLGSFANVVIYRVPAGKSVVRPGSACPACGAPVRALDNLPVLSWLVLRGRCRDCGEPISPRYPLVELSCALLLGALGWWVATGGTGATGLAPDWWALPGYLLFGWTVLVLAVIDAETRRLPNALTYPLTPALLVLLGGAAVANGDAPRAVRAVLASLVAFGVLFLLALLYPKGMGLGDVKFAAFLGIGLGYVSWGTLLVGLYAAFLLGGLVSIALVLSRRRGRKDLLPFGPYLSAGAVVALLAGGPLLGAYQRLTGIA